MSWLSGHRRVFRHRFARYLGVGAVATLTDWVTFYLCALRLGVHYQVSVAVSLTLATAIHYTLNKLFTFRCASRDILRQMATYAGISAFYLLLSMGLMYLLVDVAALPKMPSKMSTTALMTLTSYALHSAITFNRKYFR